MSSTRPRRTALWLTTALLATTGIGVASTAGAQVAIPTVSSDNVTLIAGIPETTAISMEFARTGPFAYVSSLDTISVLDLTDPRDPQLRGTLVNALFENESMTYGERVIDGELVRFVIAAIDLYQASPGDLDHINVGGLEIAIVDVTDPDDPVIRSRTPVEGDGAVTTSTHTVQCVDQADCRYAYSAGDGGEFSIIDMTDLDAPVQLKTSPSPAAGPGDASEGQAFASGSGHYWDFDTAGIGWHTGSGGAAAFDVSDPLDPKLLNGTNDLGRGAPINDFILHNSMRPNATAFRPGTEPSLANGNVLLVTEEDYFDGGDEILCSEAGSFQTWHVPSLDVPAAGGPDGSTPDLGTIAPLDQVIPPVDFGGGASLPVGAFCSAHWFDVHQDGFVAMGNYQAGLRILDVNDPREIKQYGYATGVATEVWDAYWVPVRDAAGVAIPGQKTNLVYTADAVRGIEVYEVALPAAVAPPTAPPAEQPPASEPPPAASPGGGSLPATGGVLPLLALPLLLGAAWAARRRD